MKRGAPAQTEVMTTTVEPPAGGASRAGTTSPPRPYAGAGPRIEWLDVLRGFALCGIIFVNIPPMYQLPGVVDGDVLPTRLLLDLWVQGRFFPIFSLLFGIGFGLMWMSARYRADQPRRALLQRIGALAVLGGVHQLFQPGEALLPYAVAALIVLVPATWAPRWLAPAAGAILTVLAAPYGSIALVPGLFLVGFGLAMYGVPAKLGRRPWLAALALPVCVPAAWFVVRGQLADPVSAGFTPDSKVAGLLMAACYVCALIALTAVPGVRRVLAALFSPLGRMALTNYLGATAIILAIGGLRGPLGVPASGEDGLLAVTAIAAGILVLQWGLSTVWLARFEQGPLESLWRRLTWAGVARH